MTAPELSVEERATVRRFGIHPEDAMTSNTDLIARLRAVPHFSTDLSQLAADALETAQGRITELEAEKANLEDEVAEVTNERDGMIAERDALAATLDAIRKLLETASDERGVRWWEWIDGGLGGTLAHDLRALLATAPADHPAERRFFGNRDEASRGTPAWDVAPIRYLNGRVPWEQGPDLFIEKVDPNASLMWETENGVLTHVNLDGTVIRRVPADHLNTVKAEAQRLVDEHMQKLAHRVMDVFENADEDTLADEVMQDVFKAIGLTEAFGVRAEQGAPDA